MYRFEPIAPNLYSVWWHGHFIGAVRRMDDICTWAAQVGHHDIGSYPSRISAASALQANWWAGRNAEVGS